MSELRRTGWQQLEIKLLPGTEPWVLIRSRKGTFKLPLNAPIEELLDGVISGWNSTRKARHSEPMVRVPLRMINDLGKAPAPAADVGKPCIAFEED
jgi:hypothetical protein